VIDTSGIHQVNIRYCNCHHSIGGSQHFIQLLRFSCLPATVCRPQTACTFDALASFHVITLQGKLSAFDFYHALMRKTDGTGIHDVKVGLYFSNQ
jgi:CxC2 like cysteine cluster associated with KDZ transposases